MMADFVGQVRAVIGMDVPLSADHFGHIGLNSCIRLGKALEKYNLAWLEDLIPWQYTDLLKKITDAIDIPTLTGEDIYLKDGFVELARTHAVDILHPDLATSGGILGKKDRRRHPGTRGCHGHAFRRFAGGLHGERSLRGGDGEFPGAGKPLGGCTVVERPGGGRGKADPQEGVHHSAG
jgi:hypothetical protein